MPIDALTLAAIADDLRATLPGARVDDVIQPTPQSIALQVFGGGGRNRWLLASAHPQLARVHTIERKPRKLVTEPPAFVMLLRKHLEGARVRAIHQPRWERVIEIGFAHGAEAAPVWLVVEAMGRLSNVILRDDAGTILGALRQVSANVNHYRAIAPNVPYREPPPQTRELDGAALPRLDAESITPDDLRLAATSMLAHPPLDRRGRPRPPTVTALLTAHLLGVSRELAEEIAYRALAAADAPLDAALPWQALADETRALASLQTTHEWRPTLVYSASDPADAPAVAPLAYAVYTPRRYPDALLRAEPGANALLAIFYEDAEWRAAVESAKGDLRHILQTNRDRCVRKAETLAAELRALDEAARLRVEADLLLAFQTEVPARAASFTTENPFAASDNDATTITIALDPRLSAVANATRKYDRYHKLQRATHQIPAQITANELELARIEQLRTDLALAETPAEIVAVRAEVAEAGYIRGQRAVAGKAAGPAKSAKSAKSGKHGATPKGTRPGGKPSDAGTPLRRQSADGFTLLVGKNSRQNEAVTFREAGANDLWLHARGVPGAHVIVKSGGRPVSDSTLREAAALAAYYSQSRAAGSVPVDHTEQRYVRHMKGGGPGMVIYERERTIHVAPRDPQA